MSMSRGDASLLGGLGSTLAVALLMACADRVAEPTPVPPVTALPTAEPAIVLSAPVPQSLVDGGTTSETVVFVSAPLGAFPRGARATLGRQGTSATVDIPVAGGGFDAKSVRADVGDEIVVVVTDSTGARRVEGGTVRAPARPRVVRTSPGPSRSDVPLNSIVQVVFSAPMNAASVSAALELYRGETRVPGTVTLAGGDGITASFVPEVPLEPSTEYRLVLGASARDVLGQAIDASVEVTFATVASAGAPTVSSVQIDRASARLEEGGAIDVRATVCNPSIMMVCAEVARPVNWSSTSPDVATVVPLGAADSGGARVAAVSTGMTKVVASYGGRADTMDVYVYSSTPPASLAANEIVFEASDDNNFTGTNLFAIRADGTGLTRLTSRPGFNGSPSVARDGRIVFTDGEGWLSVRELDGTVHPLSPSPIPPGVRRSPACPAWSPDMRFVAYLYYRYGDYKIEESAIRVERADGSGAIVAEVTTEWTCPSWSPDGTRLTFGVRSGGNGVQLAHANVMVTPAVITRVGPLRSGVNHGRWSPAGDALASTVPEGAEWEVTGRLERTPVDGAAGTTIGWIEATFVYWEPVWGTSLPDWSPDGTLISYGAGDVISVVDATGPRRLWEKRLIEGYGPTFVPTGVTFTR